MSDGNGISFACRDCGAAIHGTQLHKPCPTTELLERMSELENRVTFLEGAVIGLREAHKL